MRTSEQIEAIAAALVKAQAKMGVPAKTGQGNYGTFAPLDEVLRVGREALSAQGVAILQETITTEGGPGVLTRLQHDSGQWVEFGPLCLPAGRGDPQAHGSAISYARRYALLAALGLAAEDDDAQEAAQAPPARQKAPPKARKAKAPRAGKEAPSDELVAITTEVVALAGGTLAKVVRYAREHHPLWEIRSEADLTLEQWETLRTELTLRRAE